MPKFMKAPGKDFKGPRMPGGKMAPKRKMSVPVKKPSSRPERFKASRGGAIMKGPVVK